MIKKNNKHTHLTLDNRIVIQNSIDNCLTKEQISILILKDTFTIGREVKKDKEITYYRKNYSPGACNNYSKYSTYKLDRYVYSTTTTNKNYKYNSTNSRYGANLTILETKFICNIIELLLNQSQLDTLNNLENKLNEENFK